MSTGMAELASMDASAQAELVRSGEASPLELVDAAIARTEALNPQLNAVIHELFAEARELAAGELPDGAFRGVPFLFKDLREAAYPDGAALRGEPAPVADVRQRVQDVQRALDARFEL